MLDEPVMTDQLAIEDSVSWNPRTLRLSMNNA
jgi:hypothetical protein